MDVLIAGLGVGCIYASIALGFSVIAYVTRIANFAQGSIAMVAAYVLFVAAGPLPVWLGLVLAALAGGVVAVIVQVVAVKPVGEDLTSHTWLLSIIGSTIVLESLAGVFFGHAARVAVNVPGAEGSLIVGGVYVPRQYLAMAIFLAISVVVVEVLFSSRYRLGRALSAVASDEEAAMLMGIPAGRIKTTAWLAGGILAGLAGVLSAPVLVLSPNMATHIGILAIIAAVVGGIGRIGLAPVTGGLLLGLIEVYAQSILGGQWSVIAAVVLLSVVLLVRPQGVVPAQTLRTA